MARKRNPGKISGRRRLLRTLKNLPDELTAGLKAEIAASAEDIARRARDLIPVDTGLARSTITVKKSKDGLNAKVGIQGKRAERDAWYAKFIEFGTKAWSQLIHYRTDGRRQKVDVRRKSNRSQMVRGVRASGPAQPPRPFIGRAIREQAPEIIKRLDAMLGNTLKKAAAGGRGDRD